MNKAHSSSTTLSPSLADMKAIAKIDTMNEQCWDLNRKDPKKAIEIAEDVLRLSKKINYHLKQ